MKWILRITFAAAIAVVIWELDWGALNLVLLLYAFVFGIVLAVRFFKPRKTV